MLKIIVFLQVFFISVFADPNKASATIGDLGTTFESAGNLFKSSADGKDGGTIFLLIQYIIIVLGLIFMGMGINETFIAEDRGGENKKGKGIMKIIGGALFISITLLYTFVQGN